MKNWLSSYLRIKQIEEFKARRELTSVLVRRQWFQERLASLEEEVGRVKHALPHTKDVASHQELTAYLTELQQTYVGLKEEVEGTQPLIESKRNLAMKRRLERKIVENIWQKRYTAWQRAMLKRHG